MARSDRRAAVMGAVWSRTIAALFWFATAAYCVLASIPFVSEQFLQPGLVRALVIFAARHAWIGVAALLAAGAGLMPWLWSGHRGARAFIAGWTLVAVALLIAPPLSQLEPSPAALALAILALVPPVWISLLDLSRQPRAVEPRLDDRAADASRDFAACALAALVVTTMHAFGAGLFVGPASAWSAGFGVVRRLLLHLVVFSGVFAVACVIKGLSRLVSDRAIVEAWIARCALAVALAIFIFTIVLRPLSLEGAQGVLVAASLGAALAITLGPCATQAGPGLVQALSGLVPAWATRSWAAAAGWLSVVAIGIVTVERLAAVTDWNFTIVKCAAFASWLLALAAMLRVRPRRLPGPGWLTFLMCFAVLGLEVMASRSAAGSAPAAEALKGRDPSFRLIADALAPAAPVAADGLQEFLGRHTNIPRTVRVEPVSIDLAPLDGAPVRARPHIFLFVIDSLRRDYLSPYNDAVSFTPAFDRFARESTVFQRAFTRYGATGLSVPALWVGGMVLHKQYVTPFAPMNTLAKLLDHEQYEQWVGMDNILDVILPPSPRRAPLDAGIQVADYRFCRTLTGIRSRLDRLEAGGPPSFAYSLPQDIHVSTIAREGSAPVDGESYGAFHAPYASRVRRMDTCFGAFIDDLKARHLFERSVIIVTSDHGDSLGEQGRMGHAYTIFPEIIQVPLIVHLPAEWAASVHADTSAPAFTTDLTPTLYALLDHEPRQPAPFFGRPLFRRDAASAPERLAQPQVVASSYGSVYGALLDDARQLYVIDAIARREYSYQLDGSGAGRPQAVSDADRVRGRRAIRETVEAIAKFYDFDIGSGLPPAFD